MPEAPETPTPELPECQSLPAELPPRPEPPQEPTIGTIAGNGVIGYNGDGIDAKDATLFLDTLWGGVAAGPDGSFYIADASNHRVRKVDASGEISTVAGTGEPGYAGDGGPAVEAQLQYPVAVAVGPDGSVYVSSRHNDVVRVIRDGRIDTYAGTGVGHPVIWLEQEGIAATEATLYSPHQLAVDASGNLYIVEAYANRVRKVLPSGEIYTVAGMVGPAGQPLPCDEDSDPTCIRPPLAQATDVASAPDGETVYILERTRCSVYRLRDGELTPFAGIDGQCGFNGDDRAAAKTKLQSPYSIDTDAAGNLYIADRDNYRIRKVAVADGSYRVTTVAGSGEFNIWEQGYGDDAPAGEARLGQVTDISVAGDGSLYFSAYSMVRKLDVDGMRVVRVAGTGSPYYNGEGLVADDSMMDHPVGVAVAPDGTYYIAEETGRVRKVEPSGRMTTIADRQGFNFVGGLAWGPDCSVYAGTGVSVMRIRPDGTVERFAGTDSAGDSGDGGPATDAELNQVTGVAVDVDGNVYIADPYNDRVRMVSAADGTIDTVVTGVSPWSVAVAPDGTLYVGDQGNATEPARLIRRSAEGDIDRVESDIVPMALAVDPWGTTLYAATHTDVVELLMDGTSVPIAGGDSRGFAGDGGPAADALLSSPRDIAVDLQGRIYIADHHNRRIRRVY